MTISPAGLVCEVRGGRSPLPFAPRGVEGRGGGGAGLQQPGGLCSYVTKHYNKHCTILPHNVQFVRGLFEGGA
jgi:hypothetical protein